MRRKKVASATFKEALAVGARIVRRRLAGALTKLKKRRAKLTRQLSDVMKKGRSLQEQYVHLEKYLPSAVVLTKTGRRKRTRKTRKPQSVKRIMAGQKARGRDVAPKKQLKKKRKLSPEYFRALQRGRRRYVREQKRKKSAKK